MARLEVADPGAWVVKGGMALEWRLGKRARGTRDLDLVLRGHAVPGAELRDRLIDLLAEGRGEDQLRVRGWAGSAARRRLPFQREGESGGQGVRDRSTRRGRPWRRAARHGEAASTGCDSLTRAPLTTRGRGRRHDPALRRETTRPHAGLRRAAQHPYSRPHRPDAPDRAGSRATDPGPCGRSPRLREPGHARRPACTCRTRLRAGARTMRERLRRPLFARARSGRPCHGSVPSGARRSPRDSRARDRGWPLASLVRYTDVYGTRQGGRHAAHREGLHDQPQPGRAAAQGVPVLRPTRSSSARRARTSSSRRGPRDWRPYLESAPVASDAFMDDVEDLPVQERES